MAATTSEIMDEEIRSGGEAQVRLPEIGAENGIRMVATEVKEVYYEWEWRLSVNGHEMAEKTSLFDYTMPSSRLSDALLEFRLKAEEAEDRLRDRYEVERVDRVHGQVMIPVPDDTEVVYCVIAKEVNRLKIGVSVNAGKRLSALQTSSPVPLEMYAWMRGGYRLEAMLHQRFSSHRLHGEWFDAHESILSHFDRNGEWE